MTIRKLPVLRPKSAGLLADVVGVARGLAVTYINLFVKPSTRRNIAPTLGSVRLLRSDSGQLKCVACGLCAQVCPPQCLTVVKDALLNTPQRFELDELRCTSCTRCVEVCPEDAIDLNGPPAQPVSQRGQAVRDKASLLGETKEIGENGETKNAS